MHAKFAWLMSAMLVTMHVGPVRGATILGSTLINRTFIDAASGQVYIYAGGSFDSGVQMSTFSIFGDGYSGSRVITPVLFEQTSAGVFTVRGVGTGRSVVAVSAAQNFAFGLNFGIDITTNGSYTFGFINALVNSAGTPTTSSAGDVDFTNGVVSGDGVGGPGTTNRFVFTPTLSGLNVGLGTTFGVPGTTADFILNNPSLGGFQIDRTYSATLSASAVPEPSTLLLTALGGVAIAVGCRGRFGCQGNGAASGGECASRSKT
jgi:hypothetical protein